MDLYEYQASERFRAAGMRTNQGVVADTPEAARAAAEQIGAPVVIKAQVHAGGRGKAGGVKLVADPDEAFARARSILGMEIKGLRVRRVLVSPAEDIVSEAYAGVLVDREAQCPVMMVSAEGGVDIEEVAVRNPEAIHKIRVDPRYGLLPHQARGLAGRLYSSTSTLRQGAEAIAQLYDAFVDNGASMAEINPLVVNGAGEVVALDAKMSIDDNELFRRPEIEAMRDAAAEEPSVRKAREAGLSFVKLSGNVGCCVNGAGLAMATMDLVKHYGGEPANFLDIGGSSSPDKVVAALEIITADPDVKAILFNIFGGITRCDDVAKGVVEATSRIDLRVPLVIRLTGTNEELAKDILAEAGFPFASSMDDVVEKAVDLASTGPAAAA